MRYRQRCRSQRSGGGNGWGGGRRGCAAGRALREGRWWVPLTVEAGDGVATAGDGAFLTGALKSTSCAKRKPCLFTPATRTESPRATWLAAAKVGWVILVSVVPACWAICCAACGVVGATVAVDDVIVTVIVVEL